MDLDHIALATRDVTDALDVLVGDLGATVLFGGESAGFRPVTMRLGDAQEGMNIELLEPWARASTSLAVLNRKLDERTVKAATELVERVAKLAPETEKQLRPLVAEFAKHQGQPVRKLIGYRAERLPKTERPPGEKKG